MKYPSMEKAATELRDRTLTGIVALWKSHGEVFKLLGLHKVPESDLVNNSMYKWWMRYVKNMENLSSIES
ncbi:hypothetical protein GN958_ATG12346 [Phytophthora infestans]|uniref:Uncharacterized protein n=1 Tax=Phytophthora infestans TaxID=4787 RepID=A0A8S9UD30_PHYIN|nr:hypothetical protein GN958_ATG12346 [Phytophthora infestans]